MLVLYHSVFITFIQYMDYCNTNIAYCIVVFIVIHRDQYQPVGKKKQMLLESHCISIQRQMKRYMNSVYVKNLNLKYHWYFKLHNEYELHHGYVEKV